jgi:hypothetical protein
MELSTPSVAEKRQSAAALHIRHLRREASWTAVALYSFSVPQEGDPGSTQPRATP